MIPHIIHQIWSGIYGPLPKAQEKLGKTWKKYHPDWRYEFWDNDRILSFISMNYPQFREKYDRYPYDIQRWDAIRYLILTKLGGLYVDFDYECMASFDSILENRKCCFAREPKEHLVKGVINKNYSFNNALMACEPNNLFMNEIVEHVFSDQFCHVPVENKYLYVLSTTGPQKLIQLYENTRYKEEIYLIPAELVSPFSMMEIEAIRRGYSSEQMQGKLEGAKAIHYFLGDWVNTEK